MNDPPSEPAHARSAATSGPVTAPRVRTLLLCDLVDSTALVERVGDSAAAELWRRHDRLARDLLHRHGGREVDKTDGFLALFERPVEAVAFALDYQRALHRLGQEAGQPLRARVGIHVGEVLVWENSAADVADGAKMLEVEGLAKPVAARLMALALPGQILLSGIAHGLAQRAAVELDTPGAVRWLDHGRYRFKGLAAPSNVFEVGEPGFAPFAPPPSGPKAQRVLPWWRHPATLALEATAVAAAAVFALALALRPQSAIAFAERDWVVLGGLRNLTGESLLDDSLATAFRISLEQSRHVNVLSDLNLRAALARMQRPADTALDREVASEIALREGARAVILPTVAEIGGRVRVSAEVIDPQTQTTVYAESADGVGAESALDSIDAVTRELRGRLGEALKAIERDSAPLPKVTSANLDALRAYALGETAYAQSRLTEARESYLHALRLDPEFALASIGLARIEVRSERPEQGLIHAERALGWRERLTERDALYVDAWIASFGAPAQALESWRLMGRMYPDFHTAHYNAALYAHTLLNQHEECERLAVLADVPQYAYRGDVAYLRATCLAGANRLDEALAEFGRADALGVHGIGFAHAHTLAAAGRHDDALHRLEAIDEMLAPNGDWDKGFARAALAIDIGDLAAAQTALDALRGTAFAATARGMRLLAVHAAVLHLLRGDGPALTEALSALAGHARSELERDSAGNRHRGLHATLVAGLLAARGGFETLATDLLLSAEPLLQDADFPVQERLADVLRARLSLHARRAGDALPLLEESQERPLSLQARAAQVAVLAALGRHAEARAAADLMATARGQAWIESAIEPSLRLLNVAEVTLAHLSAAEASAAIGDSAGVQARLHALRMRWTEANWPEPVRIQVRALEVTAAAGAAQIP